VADQGLFLCLIVFAVTGQTALFWCVFAALNNLFRETEQRS
jgi:hypothetical protein